METVHDACVGNNEKCVTEQATSETVKDYNTDKEIEPTNESTTENVKDGSGDGQLSNTVAKHYNEMEELGLASRGKSRIFYLRNFNNWIKSILIGNTLQKINNENGDDHKTVVLDLCSGKGGDILKWRKGKIHKLVCVDIAETSVEQSKVRYKEMLNKNQNSRHKQTIFTTEFLTADVTKQRLKEMYTDPALQFDLVSCQFAFHYSFESYPQANMMLRNASECLKPGGYFIGTTTNCYELVRRIRAAEGNSFGNDVFNVEFECKDKENFPLFGAQYWFRLEGVVDCPEFLVYFPVLKKMAERHRLKFLFKKTFAEFFNENIDLSSENRRLLGAMQSLETFPTDDMLKLMSSSQDDYAFAKETLEKSVSSEKHQDSQHSIKAGTLSQAEWEAISLYLVFAFQKMKDEDE